MPSPFQPRTDEETRADIAAEGMEAFEEWPNSNHFHAEPSMIGLDSVRSCLDFCLLCARQWSSSHLDPKQGNDGEDGQIAMRRWVCQVSRPTGPMGCISYLFKVHVHVLSSQCKNFLSQCFVKNSAQDPPSSASSHSVNIANLPPVCLVLQKCKTRSIPKNPRVE